MTPRIGMIIHVQMDEDIECRAAIVTGVNYDPPMIYMTVFKPTGFVAPYNAVLKNTDHWHDPYFCPALLNSNPQPVV